MSDQKLSPEQMYALLQYASRKLNNTPADLANALSNGGVNGLSARLSPETAAKLRGMMGDKARAEQLLASPQAQELLRRLTKKDQ